MKEQIEFLTILFCWGIEGIKKDEYWVEIKVPDSTIKYEYEAKHLYFDSDY
jgi:hypothetical protein